MNAQLSMFARSDAPKTRKPVTFDGPGLTTPDIIRLVGLMDRVFTLMSDGKWRTLRQIQDVAGGSEAGVSARLRDCRKPRFGSHTVKRQRVEGENGLFEYRLVVNPEAEIGTKNARRTLQI